MIQSQSQLEGDFKLLPWDTKLFGYPVAAITKEDVSGTELKILLKLLIKKGTKLVYWTRKKPSLVAKQLSGSLVDTKVKYLYVLNDERRHHNSCIFSYLHQPVDDQILSLALQSGNYSRFKTDTHFKHKEFQLLYSEWIRKSLAGKIAKEVLIYQDNKENKIGLLTLDIRKNNATIGLLAVDKSTRSIGIGSQLIQEAVYHAQQNSVRSITVSSQVDNVAACKFYEKMGFVEIGREYIYHFWL